MAFGSRVLRRAAPGPGLARNPAADVEQLRRRRWLDLDVFRPEEVRALWRTGASEQDATLCLTVAVTRLRRGELVASRRRDVDFPAGRDP